MYKITLQKYNSSDIYTLHDPRTDDLLLINPKLKLELNKTGTLTFSVPVTHPYYSQIAKMQCEINVYRDESIIYVGRPLTSEDDFYKTSAVTCEGILAYLIDSTQRPYEHQGNIYDFFSGVLTNHNNSVDEFKRFTLGVCDVTDSNNYINRSDSGYTDSTASHYGDVNMIISLLEQNPGTVIFVNYSYGTAGGTAESFRNEVLGGNTDYPVVIMDSLWNNWCPESADGLMTVGQYLYPELLGEPYEGYMDDYDIWGGSEDPVPGGDDEPDTDPGASDDGETGVSEGLFIFGGVVALVGSIVGLALAGREKA